MLVNMHLVSVNIHRELWNTKTSNAGIAPGGYLSSRFSPGLEWIYTNGILYGLYHMCQKEKVPFWASCKVLPRPCKKDLELKSQAFAAAGKWFNPSRNALFWPCSGPHYMRPGASRWVFEVRTDVGYIAKVAIGSWSYGANFFS